MRIAWWCALNTLFFNRGPFCFVDILFFPSQFLSLFVYEHGWWLGYYHLTKSSRNNCFPFLYPGGGNSSITALLVLHLHLEKGDSLGGNISHCQHDHPISKKSLEWSTRSFFRRSYFENYSPYSAHPVICFLTCKNKV